MNFRFLRDNLTDTRLIFLGQVIIGILSLAGVILTARYCGPTVFGFCMLVILFLSVGLDIFDFGACSWSARELAARRITSSDYIRVMRKKSGLNLSFILVGPLIYAIFAQAHFAILVIGFYPFLWIRTNYIQQFLMVRNQISTAIKLQVIERFMWLLIILFEELQIDEWAAYIYPIIIGLFFHNFLGSMALSRFSNDDARISGLSRSVLQKSKHFGAVSVVSDILNLDTFLVAKFSSIEDSANFGVTQRFRNPLLLGLNSFSIRLKPIASTGDRNSIRRLFMEERTFLILNYLAILSFSALMYFLGNGLFGAEFPHINVVLALGVLVAVPLSINVISSGFLMSLGSEKSVMKITLVSVPLTLTLVSFMGYFFGAVGSIFSVLTVNIFSSCIFLYLSLKSWSILENNYHEL